MEDFLDFMKICVVAVAIVVCALLIPIYLIDRHQCSGFAVATGMETRYEGMQCYVKTDAGFVPKEYVFGKAVEARIK